MPVNIRSNGAVGRLQVASLLASRERPTELSQPETRPLSRITAVETNPHPYPTAVELRSADFSPLPHGTRKCAGSGMNSALQVRSNLLNSMAVHPDPLPFGK